ncbi:MAG: zinc-ribbon domain-containing protein [Alphaproteobacteria bacterium]|nr:zinc-ribbon domain-containing protein [Alphaproteobacteria bacterium]
MVKMILTCPQCSTRYEADAAKFLPAGRTVRCAKCGHTWHQEAEGEAAAAPAEGEVTGPAGDGGEVLDTGVPADGADGDAAGAGASGPAAEAAAEEMAAGSLADGTLADGRLATPVVEAARKPFLGLAWQWGSLRGWIVFVVLVAAIVLGGIFLRKQVVAAWPETASLYKALGMPVNTLGLAFQNVRYRVAVVDDLPILQVQGAVANITDKALSVPLLRVVLTDSGRHEVYHWDVALAKKSLGAGESVSFRTRLPSPPSGARHLELHFVEDGR